MKYENDINFRKIRQIFAVILLVSIISFLTYLIYNSFIRGEFFTNLLLNALIIIAIIFFIYQTPKNIRTQFDKQIKTVEITDDVIEINNWKDEKAKIEIKKIREIVYAEIKVRRAGKFGELRITTDKKTITIEMPEFLNNFKKLFEELETKTGLKISHIQETHSVIYGKEVKKIN